MNLVAVFETLEPGAEWRIAGSPQNANEYAAAVEWYSTDKEQPTWEAVVTAWPQVQYQLAFAEVETQRRARYQVETDGMFFAAQRDGTSLDSWKAAVKKIQDELPYPPQP